MGNRSDTSALIRLSVGSELKYLEIPPYMAESMSFLIQNFRWSFYIFICYSNFFT